MDAARGKEITLLANPVSRHDVVPILRMVQALRHEVGKGDATLFIDVFAEEFFQCCRIGHNNLFKMTGKMKEGV